jgi:ketosteroid isomerase-like protein
MTALPTTPTTPADSFVEQPAARDEEAVAEALAAIARGADLHQWELVRAAFADEVELDYGTPERLSPDDIVARWRPLLEGFDATQHALADVEPRVAGDRATATCRFRATHVLHGGIGGDAWVLEGRYEHALVHTPTGWKVTRMRMIPDRSMGNAALPEQARTRGAVLAAALPERDRNRETVRAFFRRLEAMDTGDALSALFAEDARQLVPFAPEGFPKLLEGREAIRARYGRLPAAFARVRLPGLTIRDMASPREFLATFHGEAELRAGGHYDNDYVCLFVVRDGLIAEYREYFDPTVLQRALGGDARETLGALP